MKKETNNSVKDQNATWDNNVLSSRLLKFEYGFESVNGIVKKVYHLYEIPNIKEKCDIWNVLPIVYVRQFMNGKDRNKKEIYEGDILEYYGGKRISVVTPCDGLKLQIIYNEPMEGIRQTHENWTYNTIASSVIIGNIYENPELL